MSLDEVLAASRKKAAAVAAAVVAADRPQLAAAYQWRPDPAGDPSPEPAGAAAGTLLPGARVSQADTQETLVLAGGLPALREETEGAPGSTGFDDIAGTASHARPHHTRPSAPAAADSEGHQW
jgi:hypothetical protein